MTLLQSAVFGSQGSLTTTMSPLLRLEGRINKWARILSGKDGQLPAVWYGEARTTSLSLKEKKVVIDFRENVSCISFLVFSIDLSVGDIDSPSQIQS